MMISFLLFSQISVKGNSNIIVILSIHATELPVSGDYTLSLLHIMFILLHSHVQQGDVTSKIVTGSAIHYLDIVQNKQQVIDCIKIKNLFKLFTTFNKAKYTAYNTTTYKRFMKRIETLL